MADGLNVYMVNSILRDRDCAQEYGSLVIDLVSTFSPPRASLNCRTTIRLHRLDERRAIYSLPCL